MMAYGVRFGIRLLNQLGHIVVHRERERDMHETRGGQKIGKGEAGKKLTFGALEVEPREIHTRIHHKDAEGDEASESS